MKLDPLSCRSASAELLKTTENPRHRAILENYLLGSVITIDGGVGADSPIKMS